MQIENLKMAILLRRLEKQMFEDRKCCVGLNKDGGYLIPHDPNRWTESVQCNQPVVAPLNANGCPRLEVLSKPDTEHGLGEHSVHLASL